MYALGLGFPLVIIAYLVLYLFLSRSFNFRLSKKTIIISIVVSSYISGIVQQKIPQNVVQGASGSVQIPSGFSIIFLPLIISMIAILIPYLVMKKSNQLNANNENVNIVEPSNTDSI